MSVGLEQYVPCLRWKQGEYQALLRLAPAIKDVLVPLIEVSEIGFDFETRTYKKKVDDHLSPFARRVRGKWGVRSCFVDMHLIEAAQRMATGEHPFTAVFNDLRLKGVSAIPVVRLEQDTACRNAIEAIISKDERSLCLRINIEEAAKPDLAFDLKKLLHNYRQKVEDCDLILDLGTPSFDPIEDFGEVLKTIISKIPHIEKWRSFALIGTAFPSSMAEVKRGELSIKPRSEWKLYRFLIDKFQSSGIRIPIFGDYGINHPDVLEVDMRIVKPSATIRYTIDDNWLIVKGANVRDNGFGQYRQLCQDIISSKYFFGPAYSKGDKYIDDCAKGTARTGNLTTWRWIGTNHHVTKVVEDVANLLGS
ncbi:MAG: beta family protein [bacterium]